MGNKDSAREKLAAGRGHVLQVPQRRRQRIAFVWEALRVCSLQCDQTKQGS